MNAIYARESNLDSEGRGKLLMLKRTDVNVAGNGSELKHTRMRKFGYNPVPP